MLFDMVIYVTLINLTEMEYILLLQKSCLLLCFMCFRLFNFGQIKMIFRGDENFKIKKFFIANVNVYRYCNLIKTDKYFRTNCCLVINLKQNRFGIKKNTI